MDEEIHFYKFPHKSHKWWKRVFYHIFEIATYNSYLIWKKIMPDSDYTYLNYKRILSKELLNEGKKVYIQEEKLIEMPHVIIYKGKEYVEKTFLHDMIKVEKSKKCAFCMEKRTKYRCKQCEGDISICPLHFGVYHKKMLE